MADIGSAAAQAATTGYGKLLGSGGGTLLATAIVEIADQYLSKPLPNSAVLGLALLLSLVGTYAMPHAITKGASS